jgi:hypothetical protein
MSMLTQGLQAPLDWAERPARISKARKATFKRAAARALALLTMGGVLTALIALKTVIYVWHLHG